MQNQTFDHVVIGSGFGGSVSALRLTEKGYSVLVLERGKRFEDEDFPSTNWNIFKFLWRPELRCYGFWQISLLNDVMVLHSSGVGGGSLVYANVMMEPGDKLFEASDWRDLADWKSVLRPHYDTARRMLGVAINPRLTAADHVLKRMSAERGQEHTFKPTDVAVFFGDPEKEGETVPDPYFDGEGPERAGCTHCGACMVGCHYNAKNILTKNYLYLAEKWGAEIRAESEVTGIRPLPDGQSDGARYEIEYRRSTRLPFVRQKWTVRTRNVVVSAGVIGTLNLLFNCRDVTRSMPRISSRLGEHARTNSETIPGCTSRDKDTDYSQGIAITSVFAVDDVTHVEPVRFPDGSSFIRLLSAPMIEGGGNFLVRLFKMVWWSIRHPWDFMYGKFFARWAKYTTILLIMQTEDNTLRLRQGRNLFTLFRRGLVTELAPGQKISPDVEISHGLTKDFAAKTNGIPADSIPETLLNIPTTAHILGGCPMGRSDADGVVDKYCEVFNYPGLYVVDGSIMPANPGINPSLTITALAEYAMSNILPKDSADGV